MDDINIGEKLQEFRQMRNITLRELADRTNITSSMLSQIERGLVNPSINTLKVVAKALDVPLFYFFKEDTTKKDIVVRRNMRKTIGHPNQESVMYDLLTPDINGNIEFIMMNIDPNGDSGSFAQGHTGEEVAYVVKGRISLMIEQIEYKLDEGDSVRIPPLAEHRWVNRTSDEVKVIFAVTPPSF